MNAEPLSRDLELARFGLADIARLANMPCLAHCCEAANTRSQWRAVALEFRSCTSVSLNRLMTAASVAASHLAEGGVSAAVTILAGATEQPEDRWRASVDEHRARGGTAVAEPWEDAQVHAFPRATLLATAVGALEGYDVRALDAVTSAALASVMLAHGWSSRPDGPGEEHSMYDLFERRVHGLPHPWTALVPRGNAWPTVVWRGEVIGWARTVGAMHQMPAAMILTEAMAASGLAGDSDSRP